MKIEHQQRNILAAKYYFPLEAYKVYRGQGWELTAAYQVEMIANFCCFFMFSEGWNEFICSFIIFSLVQAARNIRNLPCAVRKSGLRGVCMFAIDCIKSNGTHLGTCIDKFYFGSCCQMKVCVEYS